MNIYFCNINNINENVEDFVIAKNKIECPLIENEELDRKMSIREFLDYIQLTSNVLMINNDQNDAVPFNIYNTNKDEIVVIFSSTKEENDKIIKDHLNKIKYDFNNLIKITPLEIIEGKVKNSEYYIIDNNYYMD